MLASFGSVMMANGIVGVLVNQLPKLLVGVLFGPASVASYAVPHRRRPVFTPLRQRPVKAFSHSSAVFHLLSHCDVPTCAPFAGRSCSLDP